MAKTLTKQVIDSLTYKVVKHLNAKRKVAKQAFLKFKDYEAFCEKERKDDDGLDCLMRLHNFCEGEFGKAAIKFQKEMTKLSLEYDVRRSLHGLSVPSPQEVREAIKRYLLNKYRNEFEQINWKPSDGRRSYHGDPEIVEDIRAEIIEANFSSDGDLQKLVETALKAFEVND
jgi:hypothetical protein